MSSFLTRSVYPSIVASGGVVTLSGAGFSHSVKVWIGNSEQTVIDYDYDYIRFSVSVVGDNLDVYAGESSESKVLVGKISSKSSPAFLPIDYPVVHSVDSIQIALLGLLPRGFAWCKSLTGNFGKLMRGCAYLVREIYSLAKNLRKQTSPSHTDSFGEWEKELGLPIDGLVRTTDVDRLKDIYRVACKYCGATIPGIKSVLEIFGSDATICEYWKNPEKFAGWTFDDGDDPYFYWMLQSTLSGVKVFTCNSRCDERLRDWNVESRPLESFIKKINPAHTKVRFSYVNR